MPSWRKSKRRQRTAFGVEAFLRTAIHTITVHPSSPEAVLERVRIVLVRPRGAANVGAVARAMKNMGLQHLTLVRPAARRQALAEAMAVHARDVLAQAHTVATIAEAVADCGLVVGATCRGGLYRAAAESPEDIAPLIVERAAGGSVALLFGPEDHGLSNEDLKHCHRLITIGANPAYPSLNLAHAVLLCCYELRRAAHRNVRAGDLEPVPAADTERLFERLQAAFLSIGFLNPQNPDHIMFALRRVLGRAGLEARDVRILLGLARQIEWYARSGGRRDIPADAKQAG